MTLEDSIHSQRLHVLRDAIRLGNVSEACRRHGMSRTLFYRLRQRLEAYGPDGVHPKRGRARPGRPPTVPVQTERRVIALAVAWPTCGPQWYSDQLAREGVAIAPVTIWRLLRRQQLGTRRARLAVLERASAAGAGLLTERTVKPVRHVAASAPGDLLSLDTFYVGKLKGVGKVWQITGCDVASSYGWARVIVGDVTATAVLAFLREVVRPAYRTAGWNLQRVLTDNGKEFKGVFAPAVPSSASASRAPSRGTPGPTASSSASRRRSCTNTGGSPSVGSTSPAAGRCRRRSIAFCSSTTTSDRTAAID
jgi:hypothetical protein